MLNIDFGIYKRYDPGKRNTEKEKLKKKTKWTQVTEV